MIESAFRSPWLDQEVLWCGILTILLIISWATGFGLVFAIFYTAFVYFNLKAFGKRRFAELYDAGETSFGQHFKRIDIRLISKLFFLTAVPFIIFANIMNVVPATSHTDMIAANNKAFTDYMIETLPFNKPALEKFQNDSGVNAATSVVSIFCHALVISLLIGLTAALACLGALRKSFKFREARFYNFYNQNFRAMSIVFPVGLVIIHYVHFKVAFELIFDEQFLMKGNHTIALYSENLFDGIIALAFISMTAVISLAMAPVAVFYSYVKRKKLKD